MAGAGNKKAARKDIKSDMLEQLERNGTVGKYYTDLIDDYMDLYDTKKKLIEDIKVRGVTVGYNNGGGQCGQKKNDSVDQLIKVNGQMLKIIVALGLNPSKDGGGDGDSDGDEM